MWKKITQAAVFGVLLLAGSAWAQTTTASEGRGVKLTDQLVFHPGVSLEGRYDSNVLNNNDDKIGSGYMRIIGHIHLATLSAQRLTSGDGEVASQKAAFRLRGAFSFREYLSSKEEVKDLRALEIDTGLNLTLFPQGVATFSLTDDFARTYTARLQEGEGQYPRDVNSLEGRFRIIPGGGRLIFNAGYTLNLDYYEDDSLETMNKMFHQIQFNTTWKLLPKTAIELTLVEQLHRYKQVEQDGKDIQYTSNSNPLRIYLGLVGQVTPTLSSTVKLGYGNGFYKEGDSYNMLLGMLKVNYNITPSSRFKVGYEHGFSDSTMSNYFTEDKMFAVFSQMIMNRVIFAISGEYMYRKYDGWPNLQNDNDPELKQQLATIGAGADYQIKDWIFVGLGYDMQIKNTRKISKGVEAAYGNNEYTKHQVFGRVGISY